MPYYPTIRILRAEVAFDEMPLRVPLRFGTGVVRAVVSATANVEAESNDGRRATGLGQILLGEQWSFPSQAVSREDRLAAMRRVTKQAAAWLNDERPKGHALEIGWTIHEQAGDWAGEATAALGLGESTPLLSALVSVSPFDAAVHDAFGNCLGRSAYDCLGPGLSPDLAPFLGAGWEGRFLSEYVRHGFRERLPIWHLVGGMDKLRRSEIGPKDPDDGLPVSLDQWIEREGIYCLKVKISGHDIDADVARMRDVCETAADTLNRLPGPSRAVQLSADANEQTESAEACVAFLEKLERDCPAAYNALLYLEQPTGRDLRARSEDMRAVARRKPVLIDESVAGLDDLDVAYELGWSGAALKTCKGHTATLLMIAKTVGAGKIYSVQDLTNPSWSCLHSAGLAARTDPILGFEANARQFIPAANLAAAERFPGLFAVKEGEIDTGELLPVGLGY